MPAIAALTRAARSLREFGGAPAVTCALFGAGAASLILPALTLTERRSGSTLGTALPALAVAFAAAAVVGQLRRHSVSWLGGAVVACSAWLLPQARAGATDWLLAAALGAGVSLARPDRLELRDRVVLGSTSIVAVGLVLLAVASGPGTAQTWGALCGLALAGAAMLSRRSEPASLIHHRPIAASGCVVAVLLLAVWTGANSTTATWFGPVIAHGPRDRPDVALTFDDGPNARATLALAHILDQYGAKGTFFAVGKALDERPDISRALLADGQLLGNHSYHHDQWRWLDPRYPELQRTQHAFRRDLGVCPALYRPPHGQHTPFMSWVLHTHHLKLITWDVSANDWATDDAAAIAQAVLSRVKPGSIIDLHDGLDGQVTVDRSVLVRAMPMIMRGLAARGLHAVTLDKLLGVRGYLEHC